MSMYLLQVCLMKVKTRTLFLVVNHYPQASHSRLTLTHFLIGIAATVCSMGQPRHLGETGFIADHRLCNTYLAHPSSYHIPTDLQCSVAQQCSVMQYSLVKCSVVQCHVAQCSIVQCRVVTCSVVQCGVVSCSVAQCSIVKCSTVSCSIVMSMTIIVSVHGCEYIFLIWCEYIFLIWI